MAHADVMRELSCRWKAQQRLAGGDDAGHAEGDAADAAGGMDDLGGALRALDLTAA